MNSSLITLDLSQNKISAEGARALNDALEKNTTLTTLELGSNHIDDTVVNLLVF